ncbi:hypothetical protein DCE79_11040 [Lysinibacillus sp. 2017]|uniref:hypothetical protein n=1 Tax=unclassified Lysinibacillus TaxID=2636778 RepID=UPI000D529A42|nr:MULTISPECIES: hypothetical protein [unclassified Lysinibacillus]AWE07887.1 hypothetical protein DCE79_11040 [Lysinibacillus sp. 2017]TGN33165.1 hypothetical protein E4L99_15095 [Lysinibacillus sp. S2017]
MRRTLTIEELRAGIKRLKEEKEQADIKRGYCKLPPPKVSDVWAYEAYKTHLPEIKEFLADYAKVLLTSKQVVVIGESEKLKQWRELFDVASYCDDDVLKGKCAFISHVYLKEAVEGGAFSKVNKYAELAQMIAKTLNDYPYSIYEKDAFADNYDGGFDKYYSQKQEELQIWREN